MLHPPEGRVAAIRRTPYTPGSGRLVTTNAPESPPGRFRRLRPSGPSASRIAGRPTPPRASLGATFLRLRRREPAQHRPATHAGHPAASYTPLRAPPGGGRVIQPSLARTTWSGELDPWPTPHRRTS